MGCRKTKWENDMKRQSVEPDCRRIRLAVLATGLLMAALCTSGGPAYAQFDSPPTLGGLTHELGMPPVYRGRGGFELGWYRPQTASDPSGLFNLGLAKSLGSPVVGIAGLRLEGYVGVTREELDGGGRALWEIPSFHIGAGVDYNVPDEVFDFMLALDLPLQRGGAVGRGTTIGIRWLPSRDQTVTFGVNVPLWGRHVGETRPPRDHVRLPKRTPRRLELDLAESELAALLDELRERAHWVVRLTQPFAEHSGADPHAAMAPVLAELADQAARGDPVDEPELTKVLELHGVTPRASRPASTSTRKLPGSSATPTVQRAGRCVPGCRPRGPRTRAPTTSGASSPRSTARGRPRSGRGLHAHRTSNGPRIGPYYSLVPAKRDCPQTSPISPDQSRPVTGSFVKR